MNFLETLTPCKIQTSLRKNHAVTPQGMLWTWLWKKNTHPSATGKYKSNGFRNITPKQNKLQPRCRVLRLGVAHVENRLLCRVVFHHKMQFLGKCKGWYSQNPQGWQRTQTERWEGKCRIVNNIDCSRHIFHRSSVLRHLKRDNRIIEKKGKSGKGISQTVTYSLLGSFLVFFTLYSCSKNSNFLTKGH